MDFDKEFALVQGRLGRNLQAARLAACLTQEELALLSGVTSEVIAGAERGRGNPDFDVLAALAAALGCPVVELFSVHQAGCDQDE